jgi:hypothetical protein
VGRSAPHGQGSDADGRARAVEPGGAPAKHGPVRSGCSRLPGVARHGPAASSTKVGPRARRRTGCPWGERRGALDGVLLILNGSRKASNVKCLIKLSDQSVSIGTELAAVSPRGQPRAGQAVAAPGERYRAGLREGQAVAGARGVLQCGPVPEVRSSRGRCESNSVSSETTSLGPSVWRRRSGSFAPRRGKC